MTNKQEVINKQVYKNYLLMKEYKKNLYVKFAPKELLDEMIDRLFDNSIYLINSNPSNDFIKYFMLMIESDINYYEDTLFHDLQEYYEQ